MAEYTIIGVCIELIMGWVTCIIHSHNFYPLKVIQDEGHMRNAALCCVVTVNSYHGDGAGGMEGGCGVCAERWGR